VYAVIAYIGNTNLATI